MVVCIVAGVVFAILGIFSSKYRTYAKESFRCIGRMATLRKCDTGVDQKIKAGIVSRLMHKRPGLARFIHRYFDVLAWVFVAAFFVSLVLFAIGLYNLAVLGTCDPGGFCIVTGL